MSVKYIPKVAEYVKLNKTGSGAPGVTDDISEGYSVLSKWIDTTASPIEAYICLDNSEGAAVWVSTTLDAEDLGDAALKDVGTGSGDVAAGNHDHDGVYLKPSDVDNTPVDGITLRPVSSNWAYDKVVSDALELQRLKGIYLDLPYLYNHNTKLIADCETTWTAYNAGTIADETTLIKVGSTSQKITADADTKGAYLTSSLDLSTFLDGSASATTDYIELAVYILTQDITDLAAATIRIAFYDGTNEWYFDIAAGALANGWNHIQATKTSFVGTVNWAGVTTIRSYIAGTPDAEVIYYLDAIRMTRKDSSSNVPNPFQIENDGVMERLFSYTGTPFLGYDGTTLVVKALATTHLYSTFTYNHVYVKMSSISTSTKSANIRIMEDVNNYKAIGMSADDTFDNIIKVDGSASNNDVSFPVDAGDEISLQGYIGDISTYALISKSGSSISKYNTVAGSSLTDILTILLYSDASLTSFKCSSSRGMIE